MDSVTPEKRSEIMRAVKQSNTKPEVAVRRILHRLGFRFRLHRSALPGKPDIVLPKWRAVIFVHGCFWHQHAGCPRAARPTSNVEFWTRKLDRNIQRDRENVQQLQNDGWEVLVVWGCQAREDRLQEQINRFF